MTGTYLFFNFETLNTPDPYDYAQLARNLYEGRGFTTDLITPISWSKVPRIKQHPDLWRAPLYPSLVAIFFAFLGISKGILPVVSAIAFTGLILVLFFLTDLLYDTQSALFSSLFALTTPVLFRLGVTGHTEATYTFIVFFGVFFLLREKDYPYLLGLLMGLAYLTRYNHLFFLIVIFVVGIKYCQRRRLRYSFELLGTFFVIILPWLLRNYLLVGNPFYHHHVYLLVSHTNIIPSFDVFFSFNPPNPLNFLLNHPLIILEKWFTNLIQLYSWIPRFFRETWLIALLGVTGILSAIAENERKSINFLQIVGGAFLLQGLVLSSVHLKARHFVPFLPLLYVFAGPVVKGIVDDYSGWISGSLIVGLLVLNMVFLMQFNPWKKDFTPADYSKIANIVPEGETILTNAPELTAWYADRTSFWMVPFDEAENSYPSYQYVLISPEVIRKYPHKLELRRDYVRNSSFRDTFKLVKKFPESGARLFERRTE